MDMEYFMKIQNAYGTHNKRERELVKINTEMSRHFDDTIDYEHVLLNGKPCEMLIIKSSDSEPFVKKIKVKHKDIFHIGDYVKWHGQMWLITSADVDPKTWHSGEMILCTFLLRWQNSSGQIIERYACSEAYSKSSEGTANGQIITLGTGSYVLTLPIDNETKLIKNDKRIPIDLDSVEPPDIYVVKGRQVKLNDCNYIHRGGTLELTMTFDQFNPEKDKKVKTDDGREVWIADYHEPSDPKPDPVEPQPDPDPEPEPEDKITGVITYTGQPTIRMGGTAKTFGIRFTDDKDHSDTVLTWKISNDREGIRVMSDADNSITLRIDDDEELLEHVFTLEAYINDELIASVKITIVY